MSLALFPCFFCVGLLGPGNEGPIAVTIRDGHFQSTKISLAWGQAIRFVDDDDVIYTIESPGGLDGDITVKPHHPVVAKPVPTAEKFTAMIEESPSSELSVSIGPPPSGAVDTSQESPFDQARREERQPLLFTPGAEPAYVCFSRFDLTVKGEEARQSALKTLFRLQEDLSEDEPPAEVRIFFTIAQWKKVRGSLAMVYGLGPRAFNADRFGKRVADSAPAGFHSFPLYRELGLKAGEGQSDVLIRVSSDSYWLNQRICRAAWARLRGMIGNPTLESGYSNPNSRSTILGGFFDGTGNPGGTSRGVAVYGAGGHATTLTWLRINFDEDRFTHKPVSQQESVIGRHRASGLSAKPDPLNAHRTRAQNDGKSAILRMAFVYDDGPSNSGLLFTSAQASLSKQFERILGYMFKTGSDHRKDSLVNYMKFEEAGYYAIPSSWPGSYPGSLRGPW